MPFFPNSDTATRLKAQASPVTSDRTTGVRGPRGATPTADLRQTIATPGPTAAASVGGTAASSTMPNTFVTRAALRLRAAAKIANASTVPVPAAPKSALQEASEAIAKARQVAERRRRQAAGVANGLASRRMDGIPQARTEPKTLIGSGY